MDYYIIAHRPAPLQNRFASYYLHPSYSSSRLWLWNHFMDVEAITEWFTLLVKKKKGENIFKIIRKKFTLCIIHVFLWSILQSLSFWKNTVKAACFFSIISQNEKKRSQQKKKIDVGWRRMFFLCVAFSYISSLSSSSVPFCKGISLTVVYVYAYT